MSLTKAAPSFVPKSAVPTSRPRSDTFDGPSMNVNASEWRPTSSTAAVSSATTAVPEPLGTSAVEVSYAGSIFAVPQDIAYAYEENQGYLPTPEDEAAMISLDWNTGLPSANPFVATVPAPPKRALQTIGLPDNLRRHFQELDFASLQQLPPDDERYKELPQRYHSAFHLDAESSNRAAGGSFGYPSAVYKVVDRVDSQVYALRRFDNVKTNASITKNAMDRWQVMRHPSIVSLYSVSQEKGAVFFGHAYHPLAVTLRERFIDQQGPLLLEGLLWRITTQLLVGMRMVHIRGLALRAVDINHILLTSGTRFRYGSVGVLDVLDFESRKSAIELQMDDLMKLGLVILSIAVRSIVTVKTADQAKVIMKQHYSDELFQVVDTLLTGKVGVTKICSTIPDQICNELDLGLASNDAILGHLRNEYENGRLLRILVKLGFMNERPENASAPAWAETGDRYILKLFRDYLFHQQMPDGTPILDCGHIVSSLNKVDAGDPEQIVMSSRNGKDLLIVSHADIHMCLEKSFVDLSLQADPTSIPRNPEDVMFAQSAGMDPYFLPLSEPTSPPRGGVSDYYTHGGGGGRAGGNTGGRISSRGGRGRGRGRGREAMLPSAQGYVSGGRGGGPPPTRPMRQRTYPSSSVTAGGGRGGMQDQWDQGASRQHSY